MANSFSSGVLRITSAGTLVDDLSYPALTADYLSVPAGTYTLDVTLADGATRVKSYRADLTGAGGAAVVGIDGGVLDASQARGGGVADHPPRHRCHR